MLPSIATLRRRFTALVQSFLAGEIISFWRLLLCSAMNTRVPLVGVASRVRGANIRVFTKKSGINAYPYTSVRGLVYEGKRSWRSSSLV